MAERNSTLDVGYLPGGLSHYPARKDTRSDLYDVKNNAETVLAQSLSYTSQFIIVDDVSAFPDDGLLRVGEELVYYGSKSQAQSGKGIFRDLKRGFAGSRRSPWPSGTKVANPVAAEVHNAVKDAIINIERNLGLKVGPDPTSLNGILKALETRFLAPKPVFRASAVRGASPLLVQFQNFSGGDPIRYLWDFGDGSTFVDPAPTHTYERNGKYTVKLNMITTLGAQGITTKTDYITVDDSLAEGYYYITPLFGTTSTQFEFVDQTPGSVISRYWIFDDGDSLKVLDPDVHTATHTYSNPGTYNTALIVVLADQKIRRYVSEPIVVT